MSQRVSASSGANIRTEPTALRAGRSRSQAERKDKRRREAVKRVTVYLRWLQSRGPMRDIPPIPSTADFKYARGERG